MKLLGWIRKRLVVILIDSGATHNFISSYLVGKLALEASATRSYSVLVGNGQMHCGNGVCRQIGLRMGELFVMEDFRPMPMGGGSDVILGMKWLSYFGRTRDDWRRLTMTLIVGGREVTVQRDPSLCKTQILAKAMRKLLCKDKMGVWFKFMATI